MNSILILKELWRRRVLVALSIVVAAGIAVAAIYDTSLAPPSISKRAQRNAQGAIEILVDSSRSPIGDVGRNLTPLTARAGVFARYIAGGNVIAQVARETDIPFKQIDIAGPTPLPGEAPLAQQERPQLRPYGIEVAQRDELPIVNVSTRAPTVDEARELAAAVPAAVRHVVESIQERQGIPRDKRVEFRALGPAQAAPVVDARGAKIALLLFVFLAALFILLILGIPRFVAEWRAAEPGSLEGGGPEHEPRQAPALLEVPPEASGSSDQPKALALPADARKRSGSRP